MKQFAAVLMTLILAMTACFGAAASGVSAEDELIVNTHEETVLINAVANVQAIAGADVQTVLSGENSPGIALAKVSELESITTFMQLCMDNSAIPTLQADDTTQAAAIIKAISELSCKDVTVISADTTVLKYIRNKKTVVRTGLIVDLTTTELSSKEADEIREAVRSAPATFCVIKSAAASRQAVAELQELALSVWVEVTANVQDDGFETEALRALTSGANGVISFDAAAVAALINERFAQQTMTRTPIFIGHRGNPTQAPENSMSSFLAAYENGADVFELDVEITSDGELIIMHDGSLNRTTNYDGDLTVGEMTLAQVRDYYLLDNDGNVTTESVPTLREVFEEFQDKDCRIFVEFKGYNADNVTATAALVEEFDLKDRVDVISFNTSLIEQTQKDMPGMSTGYLQTVSGYARSQKMAQDLLYPLMLSAQNVNSSINPSRDSITTEYVQAANDRGMTVWPWTYSYGSNNTGFLLCPNGVTTDDVQWAKDMCKYVEVSDLEVTVGVGKTDKLTVSSVTYGGEVQEPAGDDLIVEVISGEACVSVEDGKLVGVKTGTATVMFGYKTATTAGTEYVLYTQPVTVTVVSYTWLVALIAVGVIVVAVIVFLLVRRAKSRQTNT